MLNRSYNINRIYAAFTMFNVCLCHGDKYLRSSRWWWLFDQIKTKHHLFVYSSERTNKPQLCSSPGIYATTTPERHALSLLYKTESYLIGIQTIASLTSRQYTVRTLYVQPRLLLAVELREKPIKAHLFDSRETREV